MAGGNIFGLDPVTGIKVLVDYLDEYSEKGEASSDEPGYSIPVEEESDSFSKPKNENQLEGGENKMDDGMNPALVEELNNLSAEAPDEYSELGARADQLAGAIMGTAYQTAEVGEEAEGLAEAYGELLATAETVEEEREFAVKYGETVTKVATEFLNSETAALNRTERILDEAYSEDDFDVELYGFGDEEEEALQNLEETASDAMDILDDVGRRN